MGFSSRSVRFLRFVFGRFVWGVRSQVGKDGGYGKEKERRGRSRGEDGSGGGGGDGGIGGGNVGEKGGGGIHVTVEM